MKADRSGRVWDEVRRALGRMVGRVTTHAVSEARDGIGVRVRYSAAPEIGSVLPGVRQPGWQPTARVIAPEAVTASAGANGADLASVTTIVGVDRALNVNDVLIPAIPCVTTEPPIHSGHLATDAAFGPATFASPIRFGENSVKDPAVSFGSPPVRALSGVWILPAKPTMGHETKSRLQFATRVRDGKAAILRMPMTRERISVPYGTNPALAFTAERAMLAAGAGVPKADVALIGVFPRVPLEAVQRLSVAPGGTALNIWVKPELAGRARPVATVTVVLGRQRSTGKTLQAVRRGDDSKRGTEGA